MPLFGPPAYLRPDYLLDSFEKMLAYLFDLKLSETKYTYSKKLTVYSELGKSIRRSLYDSDMDTLVECLNRALSSHAKFFKRRTGDWDTEYMDQFFGRDFYEARERRAYVASVLFPFLRERRGRKFDVDDLSALQKHLREAREKRKDLFLTAGFPPDGLHW